MRPHPALALGPAPRHPGRPSPAPRVPATRWGTLVFGGLLAFAWTLLSGVAEAREPAVAAGPPASAAPATPGVPGAGGSPAATEAVLQARVEALKRAQAAVLRVRTRAVEDAQTADSLGPRREGSGVVIERDGLVLTIGYLLLEAESVDLEIDAERVVPARVVGIDTATGFGLVQPLVPLRLAPVPLGRSDGVTAEQPLVSFSGGSDGQLVLSRLVAQRPYSGTWEYHIDQALYTAPMRPDHSGAALFNLDGELVGIGSLALRDVNPPENPAVQPGNLYVPVDLLKPILAQLKREGRAEASKRPWLGVNAAEAEGQVRVIRVNREGPAFEAGLRPGDRIESVDGEPVKTLEQFYKSLWKLGGPERTVQLSIRRAGASQTVSVQTVDRASVLRRSRGI